MDDHPAIEELEDRAPAVAIGDEVVVCCDDANIGLSCDDVLYGLADGQWLPVAFVDERPAELLFRHKVIRLLQRVGILSDERTELLLSWRPTGFSVHNRVRVEPEDQPAVERLARYISARRSASSGWRGTVSATFAIGAKGAMRAQG